MQLPTPALVDLQKIESETGCITVIEEGVHTPFSFQRAYFLHNLASDSVRGAHAHKKLQQLFIVVSGSVRVRLETSSEQSEFILSTPTQGLLVPNMVWRLLDQFSDGAVLLVLASERYDEDDYVRNYEDFKALVGQGNHDNFGRQNSGFFS
jgi:dTDP-4-dehydrorhamnose 3,5-epimerase-like enzyme